MDLATERRDDRFFGGDAGELQRIKNKESLQRFERRKRFRESLSRLGRFVVFIAILAAFAAICVNKFFVIRDVKVVGTTRYVGSELLELIGVKEGESLFSVGQGDVKSLPQRLSNIREARLSRELPGTLVITLTEDVPLYYTELYGEFFVLSDELRVLDRVFTDVGLKGVYMRLELPGVDFAVVGNSLRFEDESDERYVKTYIDVLETSGVWELADAFDLRDRFDLKLICCDYKYLCELADGEDFATKLSTLGQILTHDALADRGNARIDIRDPAQGRAIFDIEGNVTFDS